MIRTVSKVLALALCLTILFPIVAQADVVSPAVTFSNSDVFVGDFYVGAGRNYVLLARHDVDHSGSHTDLHAWWYGPLPERHDIHLSLPTEALTIDWSIGKATLSFDQPDIGAVDLSLTLQGAAFDFEQQCGQGNDGFLLLSSSRQLADGPFTRVSGSIGGQTVSEASCKSFGLMVDVGLVYTLGVHP